jgi:uncharacterized membrane-anchored protein YhcB (DUF1043 family)
MRPVTHRKKSLKDKIMKEFTKKIMEKILGMVNQKVQDALRKFQETMNKELKKSQKQINELREDFNKHKSETKDTIKREIYEIKKTTKHKREVKQIYGKPQKKESNRNPGNKQSP